MTSIDGEHIHKWILGSPVNGITKGSCECGAEHEFGKKPQGNYIFTHSKFVTPDANVHPTMRKPGSKLMGIFEKMLSGMSNIEIAKSMRLNVNGLVHERARALQAMGVTGTGQELVLKGILFSVENGYLAIPQLDDIQLEDSEIAVLDMLTLKPADTVAKEIGIAPIHFNEILAPTYEKIGVNNSFAAAAVWFGNGLKEGN